MIKEINQKINRLSDKVCPIIINRFKCVIEEEPPTMFLLMLDNSLNIMLENINNFPYLNTKICNNCKHREDDSILLEIGKTKDILNLIEYSPCN